MTPTAAARASHPSTPSLPSRLKDASLLRDHCYIDGTWVGTPSRPVTNPVNGVELAKVPVMSTAEATQAVEAAERAFPAWAKLTAKQRSNILRKWFELIVANREDLALILTSEQGKPLAEALGEVDIGGAYVEFFAEEARRVYGETIPSQRADARLLAIKQPIGVCGAITPWNFPNSMITRKVSPALAAGCTVVLKPANETPLSALALAALAEKAGVPKGVFNIITGNSSAIGKVLCEHPAVRFVGFTGSTEVGKILYRQASVGVKKLGLELGGNAPFVVFDDADIDAAVEGAMVSKYRNMGQTCVCANRIYAQDKIYDQFVEKLSKKVAAMKIGDGTEPGVTQGPLINKEAIDKVEKHIADAVKGGARIVVGGKRHALGGSFFEPTVLANVRPDALVANEETFGPLAPVFRFKDEADVIAMCNNSPFGLASYFYARDLGRVWRVAEALESGMVGVNTGLITTEVAPFGGVKESGLGREGSHHGMEEYVEIKYVMMAGGLASCRPRTPVLHERNKIAQGLQAQRYFSPVHDNLAVEEVDDTGLDRLGVVVIDHGCCDDGVAAVIESKRQRRVWRAIGLGDRVSAAAALHPCDLDLAARPQHRGPVAHQVEVAEAIEFVVVGNAGLAVAKADLGANVEIDLDPAVGRLAAECFAFAPFVGRERPLHFREFRTAGRCHRPATACDRPGEECRRSGENAEREPQNPCDDGNLFHCA